VSIFFWFVVNKWFFSLVNGGFSINFFWQFLDWWENRIGNWSILWCKWEKLPHFWVKIGGLWGN
jgi:hypothetical protein